LINDKVAMISTREKNITFDEKQLINDAISNAIQPGQSFTLWRAPGTRQINLIVCQAVQEVEDFVLEDGDAGFAFAPFLPSEKKYLFPAEKIYQFDHGHEITGTLIGDLDSEEFRSKNPVQKPKFYCRPSTINNSGTEFTQLVNKSLQEIADGRFEKVVASRFKDIEVNDSFDLLKAFDLLCENHPQALVSLVSSPQTGTWLGATPELLVSVDNQNTFRTVALAGTQPFSSEVDLKSVAWTQKEIEEQALVCRYIINCFKKIRLREYEEHGPRTMVAGNVMHLKTDYEVDMKATNFPQLGSVMLKLLHPTSAVCGMPYDTALDFLSKYEGYNREFYSGYLGPVRLNNSSQIFANLRCMQLFENQVRLYAGAGITIDSIPEKEFDETEIKMQNLQNLVVSQV